MNQPENLMACGIDVLDRIERIEKLVNEVKKVVELNEKVNTRNVFTIEEVIAYADHISGTVAQQPEYPRMRQSQPFPYHIQGTGFNDDLLKNAGWSRENVITDLLPEEEQSTSPILDIEDEEDDEQEVMSEENDTEEII